MTAIDEHKELVGKWQGTNKLWIMPEDPVHLSETTADISITPHDQFIELIYSWVYDGEPQEGRIIFGQTPDSRQVKAVWFDTWHVTNQFMVFDGNVDDKGVVEVLGSYPAPEGPDWGWQITIEPRGRDVFHLLMHNIIPNEGKYLAVEAIYSRKN